MTDETATELSRLIQRDPFSARPLDAQEWINLLRGTNYVLRSSDGTGDGTFRVWMENGQLYWRCLNWTSPQQTEQHFLSALLDDDVTTQLLVENHD